MTVTSLFIKRAHGKPMGAVAGLVVSPRGIAGGVSSSPLRQVLITSRSVSAEHGLKDGDLRENIVVDFDGFYDLPSGTVIRIGAALVGLTFHCEPCKKILHLVAFDQIVHKRSLAASSTAGKSVPATRSLSPARSSRPFLTP